MNAHRKDGHPVIGDVYMMRFYGKGSAQNGVRPGIVVQNNIGNKMSPNIVAIPLTTVIKKLEQPTHVYLPSKETGLPKDSMAICESIMSIPKENVYEYVTHIPHSYMRCVAISFLMEHPMLHFLDNDDVSAVQRDAYSLIAV